MPETTHDYHVQSEICALQERRKVLSRQAGLYLSISDGILTGLIRNAPPGRAELCLAEANKCFDEIEAIHLKLAALAPGSKTIQ